jgi:putative thioredoxin
MAIDVTDETFQVEVIARSMRQPVVVDLWAEWCGPCKQLGPIIEKVVAGTNGRVALVKVDVDANPQVAGAFQVQSIPAVFALHEGQIVNSFVGALPEHEIQAFIDALGPSQHQLQIDLLLANGEESSLLQVLDLDPGNEAAIVALAQMWVDNDRSADALALLARIPETDAVRKVAAAARMSTRPPDDYDAQLTALLDHVKADEDARQQYVDILELMGVEDPRTAGYRKKLTGRLF